MWTITAKAAFSHCWHFCAGRSGGGNPSSCSSVCVARRWYMAMPRSRRQFRAWRAHAHFGFMEQPDIPALLQHLQAKGYPVDFSNVTYFIGRETVVPREDGKGLPRLVQSTFAFLLRNSSEAVEYFRLPRDMVVEIGRQFAI